MDYSKDYDNLPEEERKHLISKCKMIFWRIRKDYIPMKKEFINNRHGEAEVANTTEIEYNVYKVLIPNLKSFLSFLRNEVYMIEQKDIILYRTWEELLMINMSDIKNNSNQYIIRQLFLEQEFTTWTNILPLHSLKNKTLQYLFDLLKNY